MKEKSTVPTPNNNKCCRSSRISRLLVLSFFLLGSGVILILGNMGEIPRYIINYIFSWQSLLIALGIFLMAGGIRSHWFGAFILISIGAVFLLDDILTAPGKTGNIWPLLLIIIGLALIIRIALPARRKKNSIEYTGISEGFTDEDYINVSRVFSGIGMNNKSDNFQGGKASFVFGGGEIDLRDAKLAEGTSVLKIECVFGGVKIYVPKTWDISIESTGVFGGFSDERRYILVDEVDKSRKLIIKAEAVFGGGEISN